MYSAFETSESVMRKLLAVAVFSAVVAAAGLGTVRAQTADSSSSENGRYQMTPAANGFLRLDTRTGIVSLCTISGAAAECRTAADDRAALMNEVERLSKRNAELETGANRGRPAPPIAGLPSREDFGKAMDYAEEFMRRMMRMMRDESKGNG
jgi:hypothetical protein